MRSVFQKHAQVLQGVLFFSFLLLAVVVFLRGSILNRAEKYPVTVLDDGWRIEKNGVLLDASALSKVHTGEIRRGDVFVLRRTLPAETDLPSGCLFFRNLHTATRILLDGEEVYASGVEAYEAGKMVGRLVCYASLPVDYPGKELTIEVTAAENNAFYGLGPFSLGTEQDLFIRFFKDRQLAFYIGVFLAIFAVFQLCWIPLLLQNDRSNLKLLFSALTTLVLAAYLLGYYNLFDLITDIPTVNTMLEYTAFYMLAFTMAGYLSTVMTGNMQRLYRGFVCFDIVFIATALALHFLNIIHYTSFILPCYFISFSEAFPFLVYGMRRRHHEKRQYFDQVEYLADRILNFGFLSYVITSFTDALIFSYVRYSGGQEATVRIPLVTLGSLLFSVAICIHYFLFGIVNVRADSTRKTLHAKAYSDSLTGLANRGRFDQLLLQLAKDKVPYTIISMDLDHLKDVNDAFSHAEGDRMLQTFAETLSEVFADAAMVGRIGGDEFMVVLTGEARRRAYTLIKALEGALDELNAKEEHINYSVSVGVAVSDELPAGRPVRDIYFLADSRMYEMKRGKHSSSVRKEVTSHVE